MRRFAKIVALSIVLLLAAAFVQGCTPAKRVTGFRQPSAAELSDPSRARRLPGVWSYRGSYSFEDGRFWPVEATSTLSFSASGEATDSTVGMDQTLRYRWSVDSQGRLDLRDVDSDAESLPRFFFRGDDLYVESDGGWAQYRR